MDTVEQRQEHPTRPARTRGPVTKTETHPRPPERSAFGRLYGYGLEAPAPHPPHALNTLSRCSRPLLDLHPASISYSTTTLGSLVPAKTRGTPSVPRHHEQPRGGAPRVTEGREHPESPSVPTFRQRLYRLSFASISSTASYSLLANWAYRVSFTG